MEDGWHDCHHKRLLSREFSSAIVLSDYILRYVMAALATMFNSRTDVPPRLFTTRATLSPVEHQIKIKL